YHDCSALSLPSFPTRRSSDLASATSASVAPARFAPLLWISKQYSHPVVAAQETAISSFNFCDKTPSLSVTPFHPWNASFISGVNDLNLPNCFSVSAMNKFLLHILRIIIPIKNIPHHVYKVQYNVLI